MTQSGSALADWLSRIDRFSPREIDLGLERVLAVIDRLGASVPGCVLHVGGTNGKGSSVAMAEALLSVSRNTVGTYTSPHIHRFNERIRVAGMPVEDDEIIAAFERIEAVRKDSPLTYFEYATIAALAIFEARDVDVAVFEVGMGGRLDAVNAVEPTAGLITNVSLDHCDWLGDDIEAIAVEKAGIMRRGKPIVFASRDTPRAIGREARRIGADLRLAGRDYDWRVRGEGWSWTGRAHELDGLLRPSLQGPMQLVNAAGVLALIECAGFGALLDAASVNSAFTRLALPGRMQRIDSDRHWLLDVAHNPAAATALSTALSEQAAERPSTAKTIAIIGMLDDKDVGGLVNPLAPVIDKWIAVTAASHRAIAADELARQIANAANKACFEADSIEHAIAHARHLSGADDSVVITGSFYVVGPALEALGLYSPGFGPAR